jgi:hypothetical protein
MMLVGAGQKGIGICFSIRRVWKGHVGVKGGFLCRREGKTIIDGGMDVLENIEGRVEVAARRLVDVSRQKRVGWSKVGACALGEPADGANNALILLLAIKERWRGIVFGGLGTGVDRETGTVRGVASWVMLRR